MRGGRCGVGLKSWISEWLPVTYNPSTTDRPTPDYPATPRPTVHDPLYMTYFTAHCLLPTAHCLLPTAHCPLPTAVSFLPFP